MRDVSRAIQRGLPSPLVGVGGFERSEKTGEGSIRNEALFPSEGSKPA